MNNETEEILGRIDKSLKCGKREIIFRKKELTGNPAKQSVIDWLTDLGILSVGLYSLVDDKDIEIPMLIRDDSSPFSSIPSEQLQKIAKERMDDMEWIISIGIDEKKFRDLYKTEKISWQNECLNYNGGEISLTKNKRPYCLAQILFTDPVKIWNYDEIAEAWGEEYKKDSWRKYYQAAYSLNESVAKVTKINNFLIITCKTVHINTLFLA